MRSMRQVTYITPGQLELREERDGQELVGYRWVRSPETVETLAMPEPEWFILDSDGCRPVRWPNE
jgi:hypothetical protein